MDVFEKVDHEVNSRIPTGISKLDEIISGGFPFNSITLVSGTPGSGKTILCYHYISEGIKNGEKCLFLTSDERVENILKQARELGFDFQKYVNSEQLKFIFLDLEKSDIHNEIHNEIRDGRFTRVVLDSITPLSEIPIWACDGVNEFIPTDGVKSTIKYPAGSISATRLHLRRIISILNKNDCTALVTSEIEEGSRRLSRDTISEFLVDGIILLDLDVAMDRRKLTVRKMRSTKHTLKPHDINISHGGIQFI